MVHRAPRRCAPPSPPRTTGRGRHRSTRSPRAGIRRARSLAGRGPRRLCQGGVAATTCTRSGSPTAACTRSGSTGGHHRQPSTITFWEPYNNLHALALVPVDAALSAAGSPTSAHAFVGTFAACIMLSQQSVVGRPMMLFAALDLTPVMCFSRWA